MKGLPEVLFATIDSNRKDRPFPQYATCVFSRCTANNFSVQLSKRRIRTSAQLLIKEHIPGLSALQSMLRNANSLASRGVSPNDCWET